MSVLVVGAGFSGATIANLIADRLNRKVTVIDKNPNLAGACYDYKDKNGIFIHKYGSHIFHTDNKDIWDFVNKFSCFNQYMHKVIALIDGIKTTIPFNINSIHDVFPHTLADKIENKLLAQFKYNEKISIMDFQNQNDKDLQFLSDYIYEKVFLHYTAKQWGISPDSLDKKVLSRVPILISKDNRYFQNKYQGIPVLGYTNLIKNILNHENITIKLNTEFKDVEENFDTIFYSGAIDEYFNYKFGQLSYRSLRFEFEEWDTKYYQSNAVVNYPCNYDFTRIHEFKYYMVNNSSKTVIAKEYPEKFQIGKNERYYPILDANNASLYEKYSDEASKLKNIYFLGRLGDYKYYNMDEAIFRAFNLFKEIYE